MRETAPFPALGAELVRACGVRPGYRVLDVATGFGAAAIAAAAAGGMVTASDLTPELFEAGRRLAAQRNVELEWVEADAEAMPFADDSFDVVMSCAGAMFASNHEAVADELIRVCMPGGTIGMINWTLDGFIGTMLAALGRYAPPRPGTATPSMWGNPNHVRKLLGNRVTDLDMCRQSILLDHGATRQDLRSRFIEGGNQSPVPGRTAHSAEYLLITAVKR